MFSYLSHIYIARERERERERELEFGPKVPVYVMWTPHPVIVILRDSKDGIRVLLYSTGWGVLLNYMLFKNLKP